MGRGGMGVVWRAHDELLDRQVAVKCARPDDDRAVARLTNEARNAARLHHPHIVSVFDFVDEGEICWIVMEYVSGGSLADMVRGRVALPPEEAASIGCQIAAALAKSHAEGVVHGDVTLENVLIPEVLEDPHDGDTLDRTPFTMRLVPPSVRGSWRRPSRGVVITATALGIAAVLVAWATLFGPWGDGRSDESGGSGKDGGRGASGTADSAARTGPAGTIGDARTADPCTLLNPASLSRFGETVLDPDYGEIDRCDVLLQGESGDDIADVQLNFSADPPEPGGDVPTRRVGNVTVGAYQRDGDECLRNIASADRKQIWIITERLGTPAPDPCQLGDAATDYVVSVLDRGQVPRRSGQPVASSLLRGHACGRLDTDELKRVAGVRVADRDPGFGDWQCEGTDGSGDAGVKVVFNRDNQFTTDDGQPAVIAGNRSSVSPNEWDDDSCLVRMLHRSYRNSLGDDTVEFMSLNVYGPKSTGKLCETAEALTATAAKKLPAS
ncbi:serine/threonine-protein kinase [Streptomyces sp. DASNCL29]|uniref:serine/threonine-protein kinase n=1 Tax=Streptomyces sp. DASNCL29 TaxID=2583819 RepID=UPI0023F3AFC7|nr:serine/threonine-protein kinase [Streptomyces sp. DASNCL29]